jgi:hypothetical protein
MSTEKLLNDQRNRSDLSRLDEAHGMLETALGRNLAPGQRKPLTEAKEKLEVVMQHIREQLPEYRRITE